MELTIEIPNEASAVVIRAAGTASEKTQVQLAGVIEYDSSRAAAEYESWSAVFIRPNAPASS